MQATVVNPARHCGLGAGPHGLFVLIARLTKMHVQVNKTGRDNPAPGVHLQRVRV